MMPHPERMIDPSLSGEDGSLFFKNLINNLKVMIVNEQVAIDHGLKKDEYAKICKSIKKNSKYY